MERYESYKDSGVKWLGEIPGHWEVRKAKYIWREKEEISLNGRETLLSVSQYNGVIPNTESSRSESLKGYKIVDKNNLVINIMLAWMGGLGVSDYFGIVSPAYCVYKPMINCNVRFLHYLYKTPLYLSEFARRSSGIVPSRWRMYTDDFGQVQTIFPPLHEQTAIANYLDSVTSKIDEAISQQQKMIDLLNERKQIIIQNAVTKGLDPNAKMKDSGVEWIGEIPEDWEVIKCSYVFNRIGSGTTPKSSNEYYYSDKGVNFLQTGDLNDGYINYTTKKITDKALRETNIKIYNKHALIIAMYGATIGKLGILNISTTVNQACCVLPKSNKISFKYAFYMYMVARKDLIQQSRGGGQPNISQDTIRNQKIIVPLKKDQEAIVEYIDEKINPLDSSISQCNKMISLLLERKQIIINDIVTGKVKVS